MSDLGDRMEKILRGSGAGAGERPSLREVANALVEHFGSGRKAAGALGVNESTFRRVRSGKTQSPKGDTLGAFERVGRAVEARRISLADIRLPVTPTKGGQASSRDRELTTKNLKIVDPKAADRIRDAYVAKGKEGAAAQLIREIGDRHYKSWLVPDDLIEQVYEIDVPEDYGYAVN